MRTLSAATAALVDDDTTTPFDIVYLGLTSPLRLSSRGTVTWNGQSWTESGIIVHEIRTNPNGSQEGQISLQNADLSASALVLGEEIREKTCQIWRLYGPGSYAVGDAVQLFDGVMDSAPLIAERVAINIVSAPIDTAFSPRIFAAPPYVNHIPKRGTVIHWGGEKYILVGR